jgi:hypothetical protein
MVNVKLIADSPMPMHPGETREVVEITTDCSRIVLTVGGARKLFAALGEALSRSKEGSKEG